MSILLNNEELAAMRGLPHAAVCLYIAIRQAMDLATGMVGNRFMVSWQAFRESLYIEPMQGRTESGSPHESALRRLASQLERAGLIVNCSSATHRRLIFKCKLATTDKSAQNKPDRHPDRQSPAHLPEKTATNTAQPQNPDRHPDTHPSLDLYISSSSPAQPIGDDDDANTSTPQTHNPPLIYPGGLTEWQRRSIAKQLKAVCQEGAQAMLDELAGRMASGSVSRPLGYFKTVLDSYQRGEFIGELAAEQQRIRDQRAAAQAKRAEEAQQRAAFSNNREVGRQALEAWRTRGKVTA